MKLGSKTGLAAGIVVLALAAPAGAAPVTVNLRIEGPTRTIYEGPVTTDVRTFHFTGDAEHQCDNGAGVVTRGAVMTAATDSAPFATRGTWSDMFGSPTFDEVGGEDVRYDSVTGRFLVEYKNEVGADVGACQDPVQDGDRVLFAYAAFGDRLLKLEGPPSAHTGDVVTLTVTDAATGAVVSDATVGGAQTGADGKATLTLTQTGTSVFKATKPGVVRSNALAVAVVAAGQPLPPSGVAGSAAPDRLAPAAKLLGIADRQTFARGKGPRTLRASAPDPSGLAAVKLRLTRRTGGRCSYFSGRRAALETTRCGRAFYFKVGDSADVSYLLPQRLGPGRYVLDLAAIDRAGNRSALARGSTRVVFTVR